jgi:hypothetical protein
MRFPSIAADAYAAAVENQKAVIAAATASGFLTGVMKQTAIDKLAAVNYYNKEINDIGDINKQIADASSFGASVAAEKAVIASVANAPDC